MVAAAHHRTMTEKQFMKWVDFVGSLRHSLFSAAMNKLFPSYTLTVAKKSSVRDFTSIQDAIDSPPFINLVRVVIKVKAGVYTEKVNIPAFKSFISIEGAGADKTIVQWGDTAQTIGARGQPIGTFNSATFAVNSLYFIAKNITFKNTLNKKGGKVIIVDIILNVESTHPYTRMRLSLDLEMMINTGGKERTGQEWMKFIHDAGYKGYEITHTSAVQSVIKAYPY